MSKRKRSDDIDASSSDAESQSRDFQEEEEEEEFVTLTGASGEKITPETGQIVSVEAEDFMCHKKFSIKFNRNINFVTGANGSGKSAIVAAIQLCLGANAKTTGRGSSIRSFIREGSKNGYCVVRVTLWNDGHDAYRPDLYSHKITVERRIAKNGVSNYKISSASGKVIATTPKEIGNILKTFNIFVDNPCCLLTQEASKQFIQGSQHEKYEFFLKATGLARTKDELSEAVRRIKDSNALCEVTEEKLMAQKGNLDKLERELEDLRALDRVESQVAEYEAKMHWFDVYALEAVYEDEEARLVELQQRLAEATDRQADMARKVAEMGTVESMTADSLALETQQQEIQRQHQQVVRGQSARESSYRQLEEDARELVRSRAEHAKRLAEVEKEIATMQRKALENSEGKVERVREQALQADEECKLAAAAEQALRATKVTDEAAAEELEEGLVGLRGELRQLQSELRDGENELASLRSSGNGGLQTRMRALNKCLPEVLDRISKTKFSRPVIGPILAHVKLTAEAARSGCSRAVERVIGGKLAHFLVSDGRDAAIVNSIVRSVCTGSSFWMARMFDVSTTFKSPGLTRYPAPILPPGAESILSCLQIDNDDVYNYLFNTCSVESTVMVESEQDARVRLTRSSGGLSFLPGIKQAVVKRDCMMFKINQGSTNTEVFRGEFKNYLSEDSRGAVESMAERVALSREAVRLKEAELQAAEGPLRDVKARLQQYVNQHRKALDRTRAALDRKRALARELTTILESSQVDTTHFESEREEIQQAIQELDAKIAEGKSLMEERQAALLADREERRSVERRRDEINRQIDAQARRLEQFVNEREQADRRLKVEQLRVDKVTREIVAQDKLTTNQRLRLENQEAHAMKKSLELLLVPDQWDGESRIALSARERGSKSVVDAKLQTYKSQLLRGKERVGLVGRSKRSVQSKLDKAVTAYEGDKQRLADLKNIVKELYADYQLRARAWQKQLKKSAKSVSHKFDRYLNDKGLAGRVDFNHELHELNIIALTDNMDDNTQCNDIRQCSGGERSYTTFCLLLALGSVIETPFQLMDEYDVFMDQKSRTRTLHMLREYALREDQARKQFIVLTPQSLGGVVVSNKCSIQALHPPDRTSAHGLQQQTL